MPSEFEKLMDLEYWRELSENIEASSPVDECTYSKDKV